MQGSCKKGGQEDASESRLHRGLMQSGKIGRWKSAFHTSLDSAIIQLRAPFSHHKGAGRWHRGDCVKEGEDEAK